jgi:hypothetical protein
MITNPAIPYPAALSHPFTLNDLRMHRSMPEEPSSNSALALPGLALAVVLAIGAYIWLSPLGLFAPTEASPPALAFVRSAEPARPIERLRHRTLRRPWSGLVPPASSRNPAAIQWTRQIQRSFKPIRTNRRRRLCY